MESLKVEVEHHGCKKLVIRLTSAIEQLNSCTSIDKFNYYKGLCTGVVDGLYLLGFIGMKNHYELYSRLQECQFKTFEKFID